MLRDLFFYVDDLKSDLRRRRMLRAMQDRAIEMLINTGSSLAGKYVGDLIGKFIAPPSGGVDAEFEEPSSPSYDHLKHAARFEVEAAEREAYQPAPATRYTLNGVAVYEASTSTMVAPLEVSHVQIGVLMQHPGEWAQGWPGLPETQPKIFGVAAQFKMKKITLSPGFALVGGFSGSQNIMGMTPSDFTGIPAEHLASDAPQPDFPTTPAGISLTLEVRNMTGKHRPCTVRVIGEEVSEKVSDRSAA